MEVSSCKQSPFLTPSITNFKTSKSFLSRRTKPSTTSKTSAASKTNTVIHLLPKRNRTSLSDIDDLKIVSINTRNSRSQRHNQNQSQSQSRSRSKALSHAHAQTLNIASSKKKYSFFPHLTKLKHLDYDIIDSILTLNNYNSITEKLKNNNIDPNKHKAMTLNKKMKGNTIHSSSSPSQNKRKPLTNSINQMIMFKSNKLIMANLNQTKHKGIFESQNEWPSTAGKTNNFSTMKIGSMMDRFLLKLFNPDDCIEDYVSGNCKGDKYKRFKILLKKEKERISKIFSDNRQSQQINNEVLKLYTSKLRKKGY